LFACLLILQPECLCSYAAGAADLGGTVVLAEAQPTSAESLSKRAALKEIELFKLNTQFRLHYTKHDKWQERRLNLYNIAGSAVANAGVITLITEFWRYHKNPGLGLMRRGQLESGLIQVIVAYLIVGGGYTGEVVYDAISDFRGKQQGFSAKTICTRVASLRAEIDELLKQRDQVVASTTGSEHELLDCEGKVLKDWRDLALIDFSSLYVQSREQHMVRDLTNLGTMAVAYTGAFPGALVALEGVRKTKLKMVGGSGIGFMVSAGILTLAPYLFKSGEIMQGHHCSMKMKDMLGEYQCHAAESMERDVAQLRQLVAVNASQGDVSRHVQAYLAAKDLVQERTGIIDRENKATRRQFFEDVVSYTARGGPQIAWSALLMNAGYGNTKRPAIAFERVAQASTVEETSWAFWLLYYLQRGGRQEYTNYFHKGAPSFNDHLKKLDNLQALVQ
jgi:hypothetical protein